MISASRTSLALTATRATDGYRARICNGARGLALLEVGRLAVHHSSREPRPASGDPSAPLEAIRRTALRGRDLGFRVFAGHGLTTDNVVPIAQLGLIEEMNIGHWLIGRAVMVGLPEAVREMLSAMANPTVST